MNIVYNCDDSYAVHTAVSITSVFENNRREPKIRVFILGNRISDASKEKLSGIAARYAVDGTREV
ncbi:MAG: hypothetical protein IJU30_01745, partial [Lachnospiraceae bacterium]|nr:hypothetical protein [Lachnospiraceae bacterium]